MPRRRAEPSPETLEERWLVQEQTTRNLRGLEAEQAGDIESAITLYERNAAEGFPGDWPYGRLVALYEKRGAYDHAERILERAIEVFATSNRRTPADRLLLIRTFKKRLTLVRREGKKRARQALKEARKNPLPS